MCDVAKTLVPDEVVIEALLKDAKRFKSKWELHANEPTRSKPNVIFLKRTLSNVVKVNEDRMRKPKKVEPFDKESEKAHSSNEDGRKNEDGCDKTASSKKSKSRRELNPSRRSKSGCSKSKYRSPESRNRLSRKTSKRKRKDSNYKHSSKV